jgi:hypothetical protein
MTDPYSHQRGCYIRTIKAGVQLKKIAGRESQRACCQEELTGGKPPVTLTLPVQQVTVVQLRAHVLTSGDRG